jgi:hypothetical protein
MFSKLNVAATVSLLMNSQVQADSGVYSNEESHKVYKRSVMAKIHKKNGPFVEAASYCTVATQIMKNGPDNIP